MSENEEHMTDVAKKITDLVAELAVVRKRALEIELQLSVIDEALKEVRVTAVVGRPRGRPKKVVPQCADPVTTDEFEFYRNPACE